MKNIIASLEKLSGEEKRRYMESSSYSVKHILSQSREMIKETIANSIFAVLDIKEKKRISRICNCNKTGRRK